jgi:hypothetical protein
MEKCSHWKKEAELSVACGVKINGPMCRRKNTLADPTILTTILWEGRLQSRPQSTPYRIHSTLHSAHPEVYICLVRKPTGGMPASPQTTQPFLLLMERSHSTKLSQYK